jgi:hypothetical protein
VESVALPTITIRARSVADAGNLPVGDDVNVTVSGHGCGQEEVDLQRSLRYRQHSPTGFSWGYNGSGPAQLAFAILLTACGPEFAEQHYQDFKRDVIAAIPQDSRSWRAEIDLQEWLDASRERRTFQTEIALDWGADESMSRLDSGMTSGLDDEVLSELKQTLGKIVIEIERCYTGNEKKSKVDGALLYHAFKIFDLLPHTDAEVYGMMHDDPELRRFLEGDGSIG